MFYKHFLFLIENPVKYKSLSYYSRTHKLLIFTVVYISPKNPLWDSLRHNIAHFETFVYVYKAIYDSLENRKIIHCIVLSIILDYLICIMKFWMDSVSWKKFNKSVKFVLKYAYIQIVCNNHLQWISVD